jgi:hypothetical protein
MGWAMKNITKLCAGIFCALSIGLPFSAQARFLQTDPVGYKDDANLYAYVGNDPTNETDPTGLLCETTSGGTQNCHVDQIVNKDGSTTRRADFNSQQKAAVKKLDATYTKAVNKLVQNGDKNAVVKGPDGKETTVNAGKIANALESQVFSVNLGDKGTTIPMSSNEGLTNVAVSGLKPPSGAYGINNVGPQRLFEIEIVHEGIHAGAPWTDNMWAGEPTAKYNIDHQTPFNQAASILLGPSQ